MSSAACLRSASRLLLIVVALGVLGMHALGHMTASAGAPSTTSAQVVTFSALTSADLSAVAPRPTDETSTACGCGETCLDPSDACLAVVNPRALPIPVASPPSAGRDAAGEDLSTRDAPAAAFPAAPSFYQIGLAVAGLSVLRR